MRILCLGNNTELTDIQARELAQNNNLLCHGLLSEIDHTWTLRRRRAVLPRRPSHGDVTVIVT